jgi:uncharacterized SAM-binding protein YcdF (DUF218 family)
MIWPFKFKGKKASMLLIVLGLIFLIGIIPLQLIVTLDRVPKPQAILVLGGDMQRIPYAAQLARQHPHLNIWMSDYRFMYDVNKSLFQQAKIAPERIHYDFCATDTVTNFTCTVKNFIERDIFYVYLVTSDYHMRRAKTIATLVFGSRGIAISPVPVPSSSGQSETMTRALRDGFRSFLWIFTGRTGASLNPRHRDRFYSQYFQREVFRTDS